MTTRLDLKKKVAECLQQKPDQKHTAQEIAQWIFGNYPDECRDKKERSAANKRGKPSSQTAYLFMIFPAKRGRLLKNQGLPLSPCAGRPYSIRFSGTHYAQTVS